MQIERFTAPWAPTMLSVLRLVSGLIFMAHGTQKLLNFPPAARAVDLSTLPGMAGFFELIGGALIALGLFTRPAAFICSGVMAVAYFTVHAPRSFFPVINGGDAAILYCFVFFYIFFAGPGPWSVDRILRRG
jgi:putative oxidoreductase